MHLCACDCREGDPHDQNGSGPVNFRHPVIVNNTLRLITESKTHVHVVTFIQTYAPENIRPGGQLYMFFHQFIIDGLLFPLRMLFNKSCIHVFGMVLELSVKQESSANADNCQHVH